MSALRYCCRRLTAAQRILVASAVCLFALSAIALGADDEQTVDSASVRLLVEPPDVTARLFYHGEHVRIFGSAPADHEVAIMIKGSDSPAQLKLKGRVGGVIWTNAGDVTIEGAPSVYLLATSPGLRAILESRPRDLADVGYPYLESQSRFSPTRSDEENHRIFAEFVKLKEREDLYAVAEGGVELTPGICEDLNCTAEFFIPPDMPEGTFDVQLLAFDRNGDAVVESATLTVEQGGLAARISVMARDRGLLYGVLSVIVALFAGTLAGIVFGQRSKGGH